LDPREIGATSLILFQVSFGLPMFTQYSILREPVLVNAFLHNIITTLDHLGNVTISHCFPSACTKFLFNYRSRELIDRSRYKLMPNRILV
jgi:hypothetical protein